MKHVDVLNQVDEIMKLQKKAAKIDSIKQLHKVRKEKMNEVKIEIFETRFLRGSIKTLSFNFR